MATLIIKNDTLINVKALIKKVVKLVETTEGAIKRDWRQFLYECRKFLYRNTPEFKSIKIEITDSAFVRIYQSGCDAIDGIYRVQLEGSYKSKRCTSLKAAKIEANKIKANY